MNVLQQNHRIFTTGTCPVPNILNQVAINTRGREEFMAMPIERADEALHGFAIAGVHGWFDALTDKPVVISKSRNWSGYYHLFPEGKYIAMIRDLRDIVESFDRVNAKTKIMHTFDKTHGLLPGMTDQERYRYYFETGNPLSGAFTYELPRVLEAARKQTRDVIFIRYEDLIVDPFKELNRVYSFLGEEKFEHDFDNIQQSEIYEHDAVYFRERTSHKVSPSLLTKKKEKRVSDPAFHKQIIERNLPYYEMFYPEVLT
jgi:sulfotransferase